MQKHECMHKKISNMENNSLDTQDESDGFIKVVE